MYQLPKGTNGEAEQLILRRLRVWIAALAIVCLVVGVGIGAMLAGRPTVAQQLTAANAQSAAQVARAPEALSASFAEIARRVEPAVVNIDTITAPVAGEKDDEDDEDSREGSDNPLMEMFRRQMRRPAEGVGSGFIVDPKGLILTNKHVVEGATRISVRLHTGEVLRGEMVGEDEETDLAVIKVNAPRDLPTVKMGNSDDVQVGDWVLAIGSPFGLEQTVTAGIISTRERQTPSSSNFQRFLQTDAAINRGNSGGPLVNMRGEVIGVNSQIATSTGDYNGIGFALPSNEAAFVYGQLTGSEHRVKRGYLGVYLDTVRGEYARVYNLPEPRGAIITDMREGPAQKAGIQTGDVVVEFNGQPVQSSQDLINKVASTPVGQTITLAYLRDVNGRPERRTASIAVGERPARGEGPATPTPSPKPPAVRKTADAAERPKLGLTLSELTPQLANERNLKGVTGLLVKDVDPAGLAREAEIRENMVIQRINRTPVNSLADFERAVNALKPGDAVVLNVAVAMGDQIRLMVFQFTYQ